MMTNEDTRQGDENKDSLDGEHGDNSSDKNNELIEKISNMTLQEKIGQLLIVGFEGSTMNENIEKYIKDYKLGGFIFFSRNIKSIDGSIKLVNDIKTQNQDNDFPLFIAIDEEGGRVSRFPNELKGLLSAKTIGDIDKEEVAIEYGKLMGERLEKLGFNLNFAPVLDINSDANNPVIGDRAFADDSRTVTRNAIATLEGLKDQGIIAGVKHFPGHGDTQVDSHKDLPIINKDIKSLQELELVPFKRAIEEDVDMIMIGHILNKDMDESYPATMSRSIIGGLLRDELLFEGVVISDDMTMGAILKNYSLEDASIKFLNSGGDLLLICHGQDKPELVFKAIEDAVNSKVISEEEIDEKIYRILSLKEKYNIDDNLLNEISVEDVNRKTEKFLTNKTNLKE